MFSFKVKFTSTVIFKNETCEVSQVSAGGIDIGYVHLDLEKLRTGGAYATSFNSRCILSEHDDLGLASIHLFSGFTQLPGESIKLALDGANAHSIVMGLAMAEVLNPSFKR
ncbi:TPA: hypothetical protein ND482_002095 [Citrobacter farmeri]|nr:hypothetical protein [Citrobacter farmeri]